MSSAKSGNAAFDAAAERANNFTAKPTDAELLELYGLYKQGMIGDVNTERPGMFDFRGRAKWDAWSKNKGMAQKEAQEQYISLVERLAVNYS